MERKSKKMLVPLIRVVVLAYLGLCVLLYVFQRRFVYFPSRGIWQTPSDAGLRHEDLRLDSSDGARLHAWFVPAEPAKGVIVFCHGNAGNISHRVDTLKIFHSLGYSTLIFDYRGYGESTGSPTEAGTYRDADAAWRYLTDKRGVSPDKIVVFGRSLGGAVAAWLAQEHKPGALVLESTFNSFVDMGSAIYWFLPVRLLARFKYDTAACAQKAGCPTLVVHSPQDDIIPFRLGRRLYEALPQPKELLQIRGDHNNGFMLTGADYTRGLQAFLDKHIAPESGSP